MVLHNLLSKPRSSDSPIKASIPNIIELIGDIQFYKNEQEASFIALFPVWGNLRPKFSFTFEGAQYIFMQYPMGYLNSSAIAHNLCCQGWNNLTVGKVLFLALYSWHYVEGSLWGINMGRSVHLHKPPTPMWLGNRPSQDLRPGLICQVSGHHLVLQGPEISPAVKHQFLTIKPTLYAQTDTTHIRSFQVLKATHP